MAVSRVRTPTGDHIRVDVSQLERGAQEFRALRAGLNQHVREKAKMIADETVLPAVKSHTGNLKVNTVPIAPTLVIRKGRANTVYVSTLMRGTARAAAGWLEFGGTRRDVIRPRRKKSLIVKGLEHPVSAITGPRTIGGKHALERGISQTYGEFAGQLTRALLHPVWPSA